jgi:hypothetical protein
VLGFLVDELLNSTSLCREIDNRMEQIATLRRDKWKISLKLKKFRSRLCDVFGVNSTHKPVTYSGRGRPPKRAFLAGGNLPNDDGDSSDEEGETNEQPDEPIDEGVYYSEEESDEDVPTEKEELQKRIKELKKKFIQVRSRIYTVTRLMRKFPMGQDRYTRQYWNLPEMGGVLVEGVETSHNSYLEGLFPLERGQNGDDQMNKTKDGSTSSSMDQQESPYSLPTIESRAASELPISLQSSPYPSAPPTSQSEVWLNDSPIKHSNDHVTGHTHQPASSSSQQHLPQSKLAAEGNQVAMETDTNHASSELPAAPSSASTSNATPTVSTITPFDAHAPASAPPPTSSNSLPKPVKQDNEDMLWFSLLPRKPCELLHFIQQANMDAQSTQLVNSDQYLLQGGYAAYMTPDGATVLGQPMVQQVQVGYAMVGNTLVPQTQYVISQNPLGAVGGAQYVSLGNGQVALASTGGNLQYATIGGNQYVVVQQQDEGGDKNGVVHLGQHQDQSLNGDGIVRDSNLNQVVLESEQQLTEPKKKRKKHKEDNVILDSSHNQSGMHMCCILIS